jgi:hypothetical protein
MTNALKQVGCWFLIAGVFGVCAAYFWMMVEIAEIPRFDASVDTSDAVFFAVAWLLFQRLNRGSRNGWSDSSQ